MMTSQAHGRVHRLLALALAGAMLSGCARSGGGSGGGWSWFGGGKDSPAEPVVTPSRAPSTDGTTSLAKTRITNQAAARARVCLVVAESGATGGAAQWWWGAPVVLTATSTVSYDLRTSAGADLNDGHRSVLVRVESDVGQAGASTAWYQIIGPIPTSIDLVRANGELVPAAAEPTRLEPLAQELWPSQAAGK